MDWIEVLDRHRSFLVDRLDPDFGILDDLLSSRYLARPEMQRIKSGQDSYERNERLLDSVLRKSNFHEFLEALKSSNQNHLLNFISSNGDYREEFGGDWPLSEAEASILDVNRRFLIDHLDTCELVVTLHSADVINRRQRDWISSKTTPFEQSESLLELLRKFSVTNFQKTIQSLHLTQQRHIAQVLERRAAAVPLHCEVESSNDRTEDDLVDRLTDLLSDRPLGDCARILAATQLRLIAVKKTMSVLLFFLCETLDDLLLLEELERADEEKVNLKVIFNRLLSSDEVVRVKTRLFEDDCLKCRRFLSAKLSTKNIDKSNAAAAAAAMTLITDLPVELLDTVLLKAFLIFQMDDFESNCRPSVGDILVKMAAAGDWLQLILRRRFRRRFWRHLTELQRKLKKRTLIDKTMTGMAKESVRLKAIVDPMRIGDCLTDLQARQLLRRHVTASLKPLDRNDELLRLTESLDDAKQREFILCLRQNDQNSTAKLFVKGGIAVRAEIRCRNRSEDLEMVKMIGGPQERAKQRLLPPLQRLLQRLKDNAIEVVSVGLDRHPVIWLWCSSEPPGDGAEHFASFVCRELSEAVASFWSLNVDGDQLKRDFLVNSEPHLRFSARIQLPDEHRLRGVTVSRDRIYVLCRSYSSSSSSSSSDRNSILLVYDDRDPFDLRDAIQLTRIVEPEDVEFVERTDSFYVSDSVERCVWRMRRVQWSVTRWTESPGRPSTLSSSSTGRHLLMAVRGKTSTTLVVYEVTSGHLNRSVTLPADVVNVRHVAMTSSGTFYLLHQFDRWTQWCISEFMIDAEEVKLLQRFVAKDSTQQLTDPLYLVIDLEDQVFVTDSWSNRVVQLDSALAWKRSLRTSSSPGNGADQLSLVWSSRLHYDCRQRRLVVGGLNSVDLFV